jgi:hypothetical protein
MKLNLVTGKNFVRSCVALAIYPMKMRFRFALLVSSGFFRILHGGPDLGAGLLIAA